MCVVVAGRDLESRLLNHDGDVALQQAEFRVRTRGRPFDQAERSYELSRHRQSADRKIVYGSLCLCAPQRVLGHLEFAHAVVFDSVFFVAHWLDIPEAAMK
jgi:hypothetical protein